MCSSPQPFLYLEIPKSDMQSGRNLHGALAQADHLHSASGRFEISIPRDWSALLERFSPVITVNWTPIWHRRRSAMPPWRCKPRRGLLPQRVARPEQVLHPRAGAAMIFAASSSVYLEQF